MNRRIDTDKAISRAVPASQPKFETIPVGQGELFRHEWAEIDQALRDLPHVFLRGVGGLDRVLNLTRGDAHDVDGVAEHVGKSAFVTGPLGMGSASHR